MPVTVVGDPHAKPSNLDKINTLFDMVEDLGNTTVWLGDMLDTKELVRGSCLNTWLTRFKNSKLKHYTLVGNHDWFNLECKAHSLEPLKELKNVIVVDKPLQHGSSVFLPYTHDPETFRQWLKDFDHEGLVHFCHADIRGFDYGNGLVSEAGLTVSDFKLVRRVISGHYHKYQELGKITYLGTPFSHTFGESNQEKYIGVYDLHDDKLELIPTPFPRHITLDLNCAEHTSHEANDVDLYRVILRGTQEEIDRFEKIPNVKYIEEPTSAAKSSTINETESPQIQFVKWAKNIRGFSEDVVELGLEVLHDVQ
jgi:DNA repair exonuclease SbcCD nuclease subunit